MNYAAIQRAQQRYTEAIHEQNEENRLENLAQHPEDAVDYYGTMEASMEEEPLLLLLHRLSREWPEFSQVAVIGLKNQRRKGCLMTTGAIQPNTKF